jgi:hypothetical protein
MIARLVKRVTGLQARTLNLFVRKAVNLLSAPGYEKQFAPELREEIQRYYAEDNRLLEERLQHVAISPQPRQACRGVEA